MKSLSSELRNALREIANRAGRPTMTYSPPNENREQRESLDWIASRAAEALAATEGETPAGTPAEQCPICGSENQSSRGKLNEEPIVYCEHPWHEVERHACAEQKPQPTDNLELLSDICRSMRREIKSPFDDSVEDALFAILQELRTLRAAAPEKGETK